MVSRSTLCKLCKVELDRIAQFGLYSQLAIPLMSIRLAALLILAVAPAFCADWNAQLAEQYLDARQQAWIAWPMAMHSGVACVSCHTGLPYLLSRPALRKAMGDQAGPTLYEKRTGGQHARHRDPHRRQRFVRGTEGAHHRPGVWGAGGAGFAGAGDG